MNTFWDNWLNFWNDEVEERAKARKFIHEEELEWITTRQDKRVALLVSSDNGFVTQGGITMLVEIPVGWRTGKCSGGEVVMYIMEGEGCSIIDGSRYDWEKGAVVWIPFGAVYQHYNTGKKTVRFLTGNLIHLERFAGVAKLVQYEDCSNIPEGEPKEHKALSDILFRVGRIVLHEKDAPVKYASDEERRGEAHWHYKRVELMNTPGTGFKAKEVEITTIMCDDPIKESKLHAEKHAHMEAHVYVLEGEGYSIVDSLKIPWKKGTMLHIQGPVTMHEHFNTGKVVSQMLRIHFGPRAKFFQDEDRICQKVFPYIADDPYRGVRA
jgi:quercetin dioxygenase-like cupin family protein